LIAYNSNSLCKQAELYYYDFLFGQNSESIPQFIIDHVNQCHNCSEKINRLKEVLSLIENGIDPESLAAASWLKLHFAYIGRKVTCKIAKPFLPGFLEPALEIKIPTPITVHLDNCPQCREDLETIHRLNLSHKQLSRLSRLFAEKPGEDNVSCSQAQNAIPAVVSMNFNETSKELLKHLCICPDCINAIYQRRETVRNKYLHTSKKPKMFLCEEISANDYFDYVVPYGLDPANDQYAKFRSFFASHSSICPICLAKMQQLHNTIYNIAKRVESEVVTIYHIDESAKSETVENSDNVYAGFPIKAEMVGHEDEVIAEQPDAIVNIATKQKVSVINIKPLFKIAASAAAVILIATVLFMNIPTAKAVTLEGIYKAIEKIKNVHILSFIPEKNGPVQERWVSRALNVNIIKTDSESVLWDISNKTKKIKHNNSIETTKLNTEMISEIQNTMNNSLGLLPFNNISEIPIDTKWSRVNNVEINSGGVEVYDLQWTEKRYGGSAVFKKWRIFADSHTDLPRRVEWYQKLNPDDRYILQSVNSIEYLDNNQIQDVIKESFSGN